MQEEEAQLMEQLGAGSDLEGDLEAVVDQLSDGMWPNCRELLRA